MARSWIMQTLTSVLADIESLGEESVSLQQAEALEWRVELVYRDLLGKEACGEIEQEEREVLPLLAHAYARIRRLVERTELVPTPFEAHILLDGSLGRPRFSIPRNQLEHLVYANFSVPQIACVLGVSVSTVRRRMRDYHLTIRATYSLISDAELESVIAEVQMQFPGWGNRQMYGYLISRGTRVQFDRVRESQRRVDPEGSIMRRLHCLRRRHYSVRGPQHLWHIDGNHKLIRYHPRLKV